MTKTLMASFEASRNPPVLCSTEYDGMIYIGGSDGIVYRTVDGSYYDEFWRIDDGPVTAIQAYGDALFAGTSPDGNIYMHNFSTDNRFHYVESGDSTISAMCVNNDILYVGTARSGLIFSFDGDRWDKEYEALRSISSMASYSDSLYVFFSDSTVVLTLGSKWSFLNDGGSVFSLLNKSVVSTSLEGLGDNFIDESGISDSAVVSDKLYFSGYDVANIYSYDGNSVNIENQFGEGRLWSLEGSEGELFAAVDDTIYVSVLEIQEQEGESDGGEDGDNT